MTKQITTSITCDHCGKELVVVSDMPHEWCLQLQAVDARLSRSKFVRSVHIEPPIPHDHHFCGKRCLADWISDL